MMNDNTRYAIMFLRLGILASLLFAVFWTTWYLLGYQVTTYTNLKFANTWSYNLALSHWWDIFLAFLIVNLYAWILRVAYKSVKKFVAYKEDNVSTPVYGITFGLTIGLGVGLTFGLLMVDLAALTLGILAGLALGLVISFSEINFPLRNL